MSRKSSAATGILERIVDAKRDEVGRLVPRRAELRRAAESAAAARPFAAALARPDTVSVIAEFKRRSPSAGALAAAGGAAADVAGGAAADVAGVARRYASAGAAAMSVLTDGPFFGGSLDDLRAARAACGLPVLRKDFVTDALQLWEARAAGADAVLLIVRILDDVRLSEYVALAAELGFAALVEVHDATELARALAAGATLIGINNRNLATFETDIGVSLGLAPQVGPDAVVVAESGIAAAADVVRLAEAGVDAVLVGESLMRASDNGALLGELANVRRRAGRRTARPAARVKVCGVCRPEDAAAAASAGVDYVGVILSPGHARTRTLAEAEAIYRAAPVARRVGVFVDDDVETVIATARRLRLDVVQLHGDESIDDVRAIGRKAWRVWKAIRPRDGAELAVAVDQYGADVDGVLVDGWSAQGAGGVGAPFPRELAGGVRDALPAGVALVAAGGLRAENVRELVQRIGPDVVDVSSGVEEAVGRKSEAKMRAFVDAVSGAQTRQPAISPERFGRFGGRYVPETLVAALDELRDAYAAVREDASYWGELDRLLHDYVGRPTPLYPAERLGEAAGGVRVWLKREDLNHTGAHKINNTLGQVLLARRMGKRRIIAETGAGQHGVATATVCALFGLECVVYMGAEDVRRQSLNVYRMELLGAEVRPVESGTRTLKDATNEAMRDWVATVATTHYVIGSVVGPDPYPRLVRDLQSVIGRETREQLAAAEGRLPAAVIACVGGGSNAMGIFHEFVDQDAVELIGVEAAGHGLESGHHAASLTAGAPGVLHGSYSYLLQDADGQVAPAHSVSAGLDYPGVGPEHAALKDSRRATYVSVTDAEALAAFERLARLEGIIPALESAHAVAYLLREGERWASQGGPVVVCLSGRGDKDVAEVAAVRNAK